MKQGFGGFPQPKVETQLKEIEATRTTRITQFYFIETRETLAMPSYSIVRGTMSDRNQSNRQ